VPLMCHDMPVASVGETVADQPQLRVSAAPPGAS
jgi:hypothetical protein